MDYLKALTFSLLFVLFPNSAFANFPAKIIPNTFCYVPSGSGYTCSGPKFGDAGSAATYACQQKAPGQAAQGSYASSVVTTPASGFPPASLGPQGLTGWSTFGWSFICHTPGATAPTGAFNNHVQAVADCGTGTPINNYSPATCSGTEPVPMPISCSNTKGLAITAFHQVPVVLEACYASCMYSAVNVAVTTYNGVDYSSGSWQGKGETCSADAFQLIGGIPGNAQNVGGGGGLTASDLLGIAREDTLQQLLANAQSASTVHNTNSQILQAIRDNTKAIADKPDPQSDMSDPENFEQTYRDSIAATPPDTHGSALDGLPTENIDVSGTFNSQSGFLNVAGCPAGPSFTVQGKSYQFDLSPLCQFAQGLSYIVVALAALTGVKIFIGGIK